MSSIFYNIVISPIELVVEIVFELIFRLVGQRQVNQGITLIGVSLVISLSTLPLYRKADKIQREAREKQKSMQDWITHIRKTFKGDERFMMLQAYYKLNNYSPISSLKSAFPLLLQIPFFTAAYHFLSHLQALNGASFLLISDLGQPDSLIKIGSFTINLLPILMTTINCVSSAVYLKGFPIKDKIQTYGMAMVFLVLLYNSPSGLVVYWTCNNLFSLIKNIFYKLKNPRKVINWLSASVGTLFTIAVIASGILNSKKKFVAVFLFCILTYIPLLLSLMQKKFIIQKQQNTDEAENKSSLIVFILSAILLIILNGILIPSSVISSSPAEFIDLDNYRNPLLFLVNSTFYSIGFFLVWSGIIRYMLPGKYKHTFDFIIISILGISLVDYFCFGKHLGVLSSTLVFTDEFYISNKQMIINFITVVLVFAALFFIFRFKKILPFIISVLVICTSILSIRQIAKTNSQIEEMAYIKDLKSNSNFNSVFSLSTKGKNVIVFMLDRAINGYIPYIFEEKPILKTQFSGFTYYPNTLSHGFQTNYGTPGLFGGYEYTPTAMNKRSNELLVDKHNEALKVLPLIFINNNFDVTVCDPPYAGYNWTPDLSIYDEYPQIRTYITRGVVKNEKLNSSADKNARIIKERNFFCYSIFKSLPLAFGVYFYDDGEYFSSYELDHSERFYNEYSVLTRLSDMTTITDKAVNTYTSITNSATHEPCLLQLPDYELTSKVDNSGFKTAADGHIKMDNETQIVHYHANVASLLEMGKWFDYLRENNVYDNTRIILVSDHGRGLGQFDYMLMNDPKIDVEWCNPLLMVKDFNATGFTTSNEFMTNADVPALSVQNLIENPINPFTGNLINSDEKNKHPQLATSSMKWDTKTNNGTVFDTSDGHWYSVHDNIFDEKNWEMVE